jgi:hypothetical protein
MAVQEFAAKPEVVTPFASYEYVKSSAAAPHPLILMPRVVLVWAQSKTGEGDARRTDGDAVDLLPVVRPCRQV